MIKSEMSSKLSNPNLPQQKCGLGSLQQALWIMVILNFSKSDMSIYLFFLLRCLDKMNQTGLMRKKTIISLSYCFNGPTSYWKQKHTIIIREE